MVMTIEGEFLSRRSGTTNEGKAYDFARVLCGDDVISINGYDPGDAVKRLAPVKVRVEQRQGKDGRLFHNIFKG